jgi:putative PIN family toxin of toxin-antitoxin system
VRVVFDTNVLLSGVFTRGLCEGLLDACFGAEDHEVVASEHILREFVHHAAETFGVPAKELKLAVASLRDHLELVEPAEVAADACRDADDLPVLGTLQAAEADCLVTGDKDLLALGEFDGRPILSPRQLWQRLR